MDSFNSNHSPYGYGRGTGAQSILAPSAWKVTAHLPGILFVGGHCGQGLFSTYFFNVLSKIKLDSCQNDDVDVVLNRITVELQNKICQKFNDKYKEPIVLCLFFIQKASRSFMKLHDRKLLHLAKHPEFSVQEAKELDQNKMYTSPIHEIEQESSLLYRWKQVKDLLTCLKEDLRPHEYQELCHMIDLLNDACVIIG